MEEFINPCTRPLTVCWFIDALQNCCPCLASRNTESLFYWSCQFHHGMWPVL